VVDITLQIHTHIAGRWDRQTDDCSKPHASALRMRTSTRTVSAQSWPHPGRLGDI